MEFFSWRGEREAAERLKGLNGGKGDEGDKGDKGGEGGEESEGDNKLSGQDIIFDILVPSAFKK